jgi:phosphoserine phosphatase
MPSNPTPQTVLLHFTGPDRPGITASLTQLLAESRAEILDIGQAVVLESLTLGMLIQLPDTVDFSLLQSDLIDRAGELGLHPTVAVIPPDQPLVTRPNHVIVTVLGRTITARHIAKVCNVIAKYGMNVDRIDKLSASLANPPEPQTPTNACIEFALSGGLSGDLVGDLTRESAIRADLLALAQQFSIDIAFQHESIFRRNRRLFAFDMDSTIIQAEVIDELAKMAGVGEQVSRITESAMRGELQFDESFTRRVALLKGLPAERVYTLLDTIPMAEGAERLLQTLKLLGYKTAILSGGFTFFAHHLQQRLGIDHVRANQLEIVDGHVTGRVLPPIVNGARKAEFLREIAAAEGISLEQVVAVGDGANDIPMLSIAGMGIAYRAKPVVRQQAAHSLSTLGLDGLLYLIGVRDHDLLPDALVPGPSVPQSLSPLVP